MKKVRGEFVNRDLSWMDFNRRVLDCGRDTSIPQNERLNFLAISESNLDEFISVRFAGAMKDDKNLVPKLRKSIVEIKRAQRSVLDYITNDKTKTIRLNVKLNEKEMDEAKHLYMCNIFPILAPIKEEYIDGSKIKSGQEMAIFNIMDDDVNVERLVYVPIPKLKKMHYKINDKYVSFEDLIMLFASTTLFVNKKVTSAGFVRIIKDGSVIMSHDQNKFIIDRMEETIERRNKSKPVFMITDRRINSNTVEELLYKFEIPEENVISSVYCDYKIFRGLYDSHENYKPFKSFEFSGDDNYYNMFELLKEQDVLLQHPYDSYDTVVKFLYHASVDPDVVAIKQTLYRVSSVDSPITKALCHAARSGKQVTALIEIKARFDEENNLELVHLLEESGVHVILGNEFLKTHCKMCLVMRREKDNIRVYSHIGTGNYNEVTSKIYTDLSYLTSRRKVGADLLHVFNILSGVSSPDDKLQKVAYAPVNLRATLVSNIDREIAYAKKGKKAEIFMKINALSDEEMVDKLYEAADAGVKIDIICRGACSIVPRKNLTVKSIVGRFLEHSRIYYFMNGKNLDYYISSADLLTRNLDRRVEILINLKDSDVVAQVQWIREVFMKDTKNSFILNSDRSWHRASSNGKGFDAHQWFIEYSDVKKRKKKWKYHEYNDIISMKEGDKIDRNFVKSDES